MINILFITLYTYSQFHPFVIDNIVKFELNIFQENEISGVGNGYSYFFRIFELFFFRIFEDYHKIVSPYLI